MKHNAHRSLSNKTTVNGSAVTGLSADSRACSCKCLPSSTFCDPYKVSGMSDVSEKTLILVFQRDVHHSWTITSLGDAVTVLYTDELAKRATANMVESGLGIF